MKLEEQETNINFDYCDRVVRIYTTQQYVVDGFIKRNPEALKDRVNRLGHGWEFTIPMSDLRKPYTLIKIARNGGLEDNLDDEVEIDTSDAA